MFNAHISYLDGKIQHWSGMYENYNSQRDYRNNLYDKLKSEIDALDENTYNVSNFGNEHRRLLNKINADADAAYKYFTSKQ
ncbi:MAG: hypothetical protein IPK21_21035 [Haliscomenobacter sp.]|nr:hypothetical protein [Haliscomenobacter sp.]